MSTETPPPDDNDEDCDAEKRLYHQQYWSQYSQTRKRVTGMLTSGEYAKIEQRAEDAGRKVWSQIHAEAEAYTRKEYLPPKDVEEQISELIVQFRRLGNNVNQIARTLNTDGRFDEPEFVRNLEDLESLIQDFVKKPWVDPPDNDEPK